MTLDLHRRTAKAKLSDDERELAENLLKSALLAAATILT